MTTFLLLISLLLNGVAIFFIIILFTRQNRFSEVENKQEKMMKEMEEIISSYLYQMKEENEDFLLRFQQTNRKESGTANPQKHTEINNSSRKQPEMIGRPADTKTGGELAGKTAGSIKKEAIKAYKKSSAEKQGRQSEFESSSQEPSSESIAASGHETESADSAAKSSSEEIYRDLLINQVLILQKQGLTIEEIARKLGKGKTEIELLLKFTQNHEH